MKFEDALKKLAEKWPEKFRLSDGGGFFHKDSHHWHNGSRFLHPDPGVVGDITQDDLDEIAGLIGWTYDVVGCYYSGKGAPGRYLNEHTGKQFWYHDIWQQQGERPTSSTETFPTKLEAAKAALIAVVEKEAT